MRLHHLLPALSISLHLASSLPTCPFDICPAPSTPPAICGTAPVSPLGRRRDVAVARTTPLCCWLSGTANHALVNGIPSPVFYLPAGTYMISWANFFLVGAASEAIVNLEVWTQGANGVNMFLDQLWSQGETVVSDGVTGMYLVLKQLGTGPHQVVLPWALAAQ
ncbi:hypothetical protein MMC12_005607 [Toensbergia leucococca]|nr:hypothetical protein [Toensbergia leucococca]